MNRQIKSNRLNVNAGIMAWYVKELKNLTNQMTAECTKELTKIYKNGIKNFLYTVNFIKVN